MFVVDALILNGSVRPISGANPRRGAIAGVASSVSFYMLQGTSMKTPSHIRSFEFLKCTEDERAISAMERLGSSGDLGEMLGSVHDIPAQWNGVDVMSNKVRDYYATALCASWRSLASAAGEHGIRFD